MNRTLITAVISVLLAPPVFAGISAAGFSGIWEQEMSFISNEGEVQKFEALLEPEWNFKFEDGPDLTIIGRARLDLVGDLGPIESRPDNYSGFNGPWFQGSQGEITLREAYLDAEWFGFFWRVGKQQVVWGQADGLKVLDVVNPQSFREFILDDFDTSRIPLWMLNVEVPVTGDDTLQFLWIPDTTYSELAEPGSPYQITSPRLVPTIPGGAPEGVPVNVLSPLKMDRLLAGSDIGVRLASFRGGWDITVNYFYHYADLPVFYQEFDANGIIIRPRYERSHLLGGTLSNAFGDFTVRAEIGFNSDSFNISKNFLTRGVSNSPELASVLGLDWQGLNDTFVSVQWFQSHLFDYEPGTVRDRTENTLSFLVQRYFANETWKLELLALQSLNEHDGLLRPKLTHTMLSNLDIWLSADLFYGNEDGLFGQFDQADRISAGFRLGF